MINIKKPILKRVYFLKEESKEGSLERSKNSTDKRVVDLKLTDKGEHILKKIKSHYSILFAGLL